MRFTVIGAGTMGRGIAHVAALAGHDTVLTDVSPAVLDSALAAIGANLDKGVEKGKVAAADRAAALERITTETDLAAAVRDAEVVVEAAPENLDLKREIFGTLDAAAPGDALLATNTSSLPVHAIASAVEHPQRVLGMHFFNPVHLMPLLEIVRTADTWDETIDLARSLGEGMGKECIVVRDAPGFATSRLGVVLGLEAIRMLEEEVASAEDIDKAMTLGYRHPMGPLRLTDLVGLDVRLAIAEHLYETLGSEAFRPPELLRRKVAAGELGKKTGKGFHRWE